MYLLDTHALWHHASNGDGLSPRVARRLDESLVTDLLVLDVSLYELARLIAIGRIKVEAPLQTVATIEESYPILHSDAEIAWKSASLDWPKRRGSSGAVAQLEERVVRNDEVVGSIPISSTSLRSAGQAVGIGYLSILLLAHPGRRL
jgi:PIN domain nuclease of toxin-antitoxin system